VSATPAQRRLAREWLDNPASWNRYVTVDAAVRDLEGRIVGEISHSKVPAMLDRLIALDEAKP